MKSSRRGGWLWVAVILLAVLLPTRTAWAWGPATHVEIAGEVLRNLGLIPAALAVLLARQRAAYLYGAVAADMVFAKRMSRVRQFCHHWSTGFRLLQRAAAEPDRAFAYGYLSHLAADTVAHGKYVPRQITLTGCTMNFGHFYWELRADTLASGDAWSNLRTVLDEDHDAHHLALSRHLTGTFLPYALNRRLFAGMNQTVLHPLPRRAVETMADYSRHSLSSDLVSRYQSECVDRTFDLLNRLQSSALLREDPNGATALTRVRVVRRDLKRLKRRGEAVEPYARELAAGLGPAPLSDPRRESMPWAVGFPSPAPHQACRAPAGDAVLSP